MSVMDLEIAIISLYPVIFAKVMGLIILKWWWLVTLHQEPDPLSYMSLPLSLIENFIKTEDIIDN